jgi:phenylacetic acid degradation operon negative regulatory protein
MSQDCNTSADLGLLPLSARSVVASVLMATHPPLLPTAVLVRLCDRFGIAPGTTRVALSRMVAAGELAQDGSAGYRLAGPELLARMRAQDEARRPPSAPWTGDWRLAVVVSGGRLAADRAELRRGLAAARFAEWREGVWLRPANLPAPDGALAGDPCRWLLARPDDDPVELAARLWDLDGWGRRGRELVGATEAEPGDLVDAAAGRPVAVFTAAAALLRHLRTDPLLPAELVPAGWPGDELRTRYTAHVRSIQELIRDIAGPGART